jgi:hypothetical protein
MRYLGGEDAKLFRQSKLAVTSIEQSVVNVAGISETGVPVM